MQQLLMKHEPSLGKQERVEKKLKTNLPCLDLFWCKRKGGERLSGSQDSVIIANTNKMEFSWYSLCLLGIIVRQRRC